MQVKPGSSIEVENKDKRTMKSALMLLFVCGVTLKASNKMQKLLFQKGTSSKRSRQNLKKQDGRELKKNQI